MDLRDYSGIVQCVVDGSVDVRSEWVLRVEGMVRNRPEGTDNAELATGQVELADCTVEVLSEAEPPPFPVDDRAEVDESVRLRYRFVDLRRPRMQRNLRLRGRVLAAMRGGDGAAGILRGGDPAAVDAHPRRARGSSRCRRGCHRGKFYVLPQSPQIAKQLLMVAGMDRYFQIARCLRDEDLRADRQFEFTQLDIEASFVTERDVQDAVTVAVVDATEAAVGERPADHRAHDLARGHGPLRRGQARPALRDGARRPAPGLRRHRGARLRGPVREGGVRAGAAPRSAATGSTPWWSGPRSSGAKGLAWFRVTSDAPLALTSPLDKVLSDAERAGLVAATGAVPGDLVLVVADEWRRACEVLGQLRLDLGRLPVGQGERRFLWVTEFPLFDGTDDDGNPQAAHHPFTMPHPDDLDLLASDPVRVRSQAYDLVLNGWELGSGSIRIHREDIQRRVFDALGIPPAEAEARFGFLLGAFRYGAPPHGGFAVGVDRLRGHLVGRGEPARGDRLSEDPVRDRPHDRCPQGAGASRPARAGICASRPRATEPRRRRPRRGRRHGKPVAAPPGAAPARPLRPGGHRTGSANGPRWRRACGPAPSTTSSGQRHLVAPDAPLRVLIEQDRLTSAILWGPAGTGKTTLAQVVAATTAKTFVPLSAVNAGVADVRHAIDEARRLLGEQGRGTILFIDEVHRFNKSQQDALLPAVEEGLVVLIGATTENPFFSVNSPLAEPGDAVAPRAARRRRRRRGDPARARGRGGPRPTPTPWTAMVSVADGDARAALGHPRGGRGPGRWPSPSPPTVVERARAGRLHAPRAPTPTTTR